MRRQALCISVATIVPNEANSGGCRAGTPNLRRVESCETKPNCREAWALAPMPRGRPRTDCVNEANWGLPAWSRPNDRPPAPAARLAPIGFVSRHRRAAPAGRPRLASFGGTPMPRERPRGRKVIGQNEANGPGKAAQLGRGFFFLYSSPARGYTGSFSIQQAASRFGWELTDHEK